ncbi:MAG: archaellin/type IV pilin N-terminal domain-containing protein [Candidatus Hodarchaeota archaeon]
MKKIINYFRFINKKRAISPVIAVILLIGLAVAASAAIFLIVLPLITPQPEPAMSWALVEYDSVYTKALDIGEGYGLGTVAVSNMGTADYEITAIRIYYALTLTSTWTEITNALSVENISESNPFTVAKTELEDIIHVQFPIPVENDDNTVYYRMVLEIDGEKDLDTALEAEIVSEEDVKLGKDRPDISFANPKATLRKKEVISPIVQDNAEIKNVTYEVFLDTSLNKTKTITGPNYWYWDWTTYNYSADGLDNGSYTMRITVYDYAGLSANTQADYPSDIAFIIDNDYVSPKITNVQGSSVKNGVGVAEVGESYNIQATITDSGSAVSKVKVDGVKIHYKVNDTGIPGYSEVFMTDPEEDGLWKGSIPVVVREALAKNLTFYISAEDLDSNKELTNDFYADVNDSTKPDFTEHTPVIFATEGLPITLSATVEDEDIVQSVTVVWRERNDTTLGNLGSWEVLTNSSGTGETWEFEIPYYNATIDGIDYYINATDPSGNTAYVYVGTPSSPYQITIYDTVTPTIELESSVPSQITANTDLTVQVIVGDNDKSFSWSGGATGQVTLEYNRKNLDPADFYNQVPTNHVSGDSASSGTVFWGTGIWQGTINGGNFSTSNSPVKLRIRAEDNLGGNIKTYYVTPDIYVIAPGIPILTYIPGSVDVTGSKNHTLSFKVNNTATGSADATITDIQIELLNNTKPKLAGDPYIIQINATGATNPVWVNGSNTGGANNSKLQLNNSIILIAGAQTTFTVIYANSSDTFFDINDLTVNVTIYHTGPGGYQILENFNTPITAIQTITEVRYMRNQDSTTPGYMELGIAQTTNGQEIQEVQTGLYRPSVTWGIRVFIRHSNGTETEITPGSWVNTVTKSTEIGNIQSSNTWQVPETDLDPTDAIVIRVYVEIQGYSRRELVAFKTEELGAIKLKSSYWTVYYWTRIDYQQFGFRTRSYFGFGDSTYNSHITNIQYEKIG